MELTARQIEFADAALRLLARSGMASVSFRTVAAEAGMSLGAVQKAFPSKDELLAAMLQRMRDRLTQPLLGEPGRPELRAWLVDLMVSVLPLDEARRTAELQASGFAERAAHDEAIARVIAEGDREIVGRIALLIGRGIAEGEVSPGLDPDMCARGWLAIAQGLSAELLYDPRPEDEIRALVRFLVDRLLGTDPRTDRG